MPTAEEQRLMNLENQRIAIENNAIVSKTSLDTASATVKLAKELLYTTSTSSATFSEIRNGKASAS